MALCETDPVVGFAALTKATGMLFEAVYYEAICKGHAARQHRLNAHTSVYVIPGALFLVFFFFFFKF